MTIAVLTILLILGTARLLGQAKKNPTRANYLFVLLGGLATFLFMPLIIILFTDGLSDGGAIQLSSTIFGIYFIVWSIRQLIKNRQLVRDNIMKCANCNKANGADDKFCRHCGIKSNPTNLEAKINEAKHQLESEQNSHPKVFTSADFNKWVQKKFVIITSLAMVGIIVMGGIFFLDEYNTLKQQTQTMIDDQNKRLAEEQKQLTASQAKSEADQKALQTRIAQVQADAEKRAAATAIAVNNSANDSYSAISAEWQNRVVQVRCYWFSDDTWGGGSATIVNIASPYGLVAVTNAHVITNATEYGPDTCTISNALGFRTITNDSVGTYFISGMKGTSQRDWAYIKMGSPTGANDNGGFENAAASRLKVCNASDVQQGDKVLILGYPWNGSRVGVTTTQGIISGFDGDYYVTDAKIDHGNSGGAAILIKNDCWLGIPSAAVVGTIESYGRILQGRFVVGQ